MKFLSRFFCQTCGCVIWSRVIHDSQCYPIFTVVREREMSNPGFIARSQSRRQHPSSKER